MATEQTTANRGYQLPYATNPLSVDVERLRSALTAIDADVFARYTKAEVDALLTTVLSQANTQAQTLINGIVAGAPEALNTLDELAAALGDDANFAASVTNALSNRYTKAESDARYVQGTTQTEMVFTATAGQTAFTLTTPAASKSSILVTVDGLIQPTSEYNLNIAGTVLTFTEAVPTGSLVRVLVLGTAGPVVTPGDDTVTTAKIRNGAVTPAKLDRVYATAAFAYFCSAF